MQLNNEFAPVMKSSTKMETGQASIEMTAHMFQILSAGIYQHPERACIRELSINGLDGQQMANKLDVPLDVHLPTRLEPYFEVRDHGVGMTHEQVMKLYLTYGASTKRDSNDQVGGLGIGSKSPFAVAQSFTVTVYQQGIVRRYSIYMEEGVPQVTKLTESPTTETDGVAVRVAVPLDKIDKFLKEANIIYTHFPVKPNCNLQLTGLYDDCKVMSESPGEFVIFSGTNNSRSIDTSIVMGNIEYPIKLDDVMPNYADIVPSFLRSSISKALIYLPIGSVNIAASRESLQLTDSTKKEVERVFEKVSKEILSKFQAKIDTATNLYEAVKIYQESVNSGSSTVNHNIMKHLTFQGKTLLDWQDEQAFCRTEDDIDPQTGMVRKDYHGKPKRKFKFEGVVYQKINQTRNNSEKRVESYTANSENEFSLFGTLVTPGFLEKCMIFVIEDRFQKNGAKKSVGRAAVMREIANKAVEAGVDTYGRIYLVDSEQEIKDLAKLHHYPESLLRIYKASDYDYAYVPKKIVRGQVKVWQSKRGGQMFETKVDLDSYDDPQYYIRAEGNNMTSATLRDQQELGDNMTTLSKIVPTGEVFMFRKTVWNKIPEEWIEVDLATIEKQLKQNPVWWIDHNRNVTATYAASRSKINLSRARVKLWTRHHGKLVQDGHVDVLRDKVTPDPQGVNFEDNMETLQDLFGRVPIVFADSFFPEHRHATSLLEQVQRLIPKNSGLYIKIQSASVRATEKIEKEKRKAKKKYPLLSWIDWSTVSLREVAEYLGFTVTPYVSKK